MIKSMTGFGRASGPLSARLSAAITVRTVNHRNLELSLRLPESLWETEPFVRAFAGEFFSRGKTDIVIRIQRLSEPDYQVRLNSKVASAVIPQLRTLLAEQGITQPITGSDLMRVPDLLQVEALDQEWDDTEHEALRGLLRTAFENVNAMRAKEGEGLRRDIVARLDLIASRRAELDAQRETITREALDAFRRRVADLARSTGAEVAEERVAQEIVLLVERMDIAEELTRLDLHLDQMRTTLDSREAVGKKLDFLVQEMMREINTIGSKSRSSGIRTTVIELKTEVERVREQVQNVE
jgi:uncharacterized protein (TIGR00255 family)